MIDEYSKAYEKYYFLRYGMEDEVIKQIINHDFNGDFDDDDIKQLRKMIGILNDKKINILVEQEVASGLAGN